MDPGPKDVVNGWRIPPGSGSSFALSNYPSVVDGVLQDVVERPVVHALFAGEFVDRYGTRRSAWWNLFPLGWGDRVENSRSPSGPLWMAQVDHVADLFWSTVELLDPKRVVILAGKGYWDPMAGPLGLANLEPKRKPLIAADLRGGRTFVWSYHPQGRGLGARDAFAEAIVNAVREVEAIGGLERGRSGP